MQKPISLLFRALLKRPPRRMIPLFQPPLPVTLVHIRQITAHLLRREAIQIGQTQGLKNVLLKIVVELQAGGAFDDEAGPVDVGAVLPRRAWLVEQRRIEDILLVPCKLVDAEGAAPNRGTGVEEGVGEACGVGEEHAEGDWSLLVCGRDAVCVYFFLSDLRRVLPDGFRVVERQDTLLDKLHACD